jgi:uncharacterized protein involved in outer membrane biogenesis
MRLRTILLVILLLILAVPAVGALGLWWIDESVYRRLIAERVEQATGRKLTIDGRLRLALALRPTLAVERVVLANPPWASRPALAELERLELRLDALSLLAGRPEIDRLTLVRPVVHLEVGPDGRPNWEFAPGTPPPAGDAAPEPGGGGILPAVHELAVQAGLVTYRDGRSGAEHALRLDRALVLNLKPHSPTSLDVAGAIDGLPLVVKGQTGPLAAFLAGGSLPVDLAGRIAGIKGELGGTVTSPAEPSVSLAFRLEADDPAALAGPLAGLGTLLPLDLQGRIEGDRRRLELPGLSLASAGGTLTGKGALALDGPRPRVEATLAADRLDLRPVLAGPGRAGGEPGAAGGEPEPLFSKEPLPLAGLIALDGQASLKIRELETGRLPARDLELGATLADGRLQVEPLRLTLEGRPVTGSLGVDAQERPPRLRLELDGRRLELGRLLERLAVTGLLEGEGNLRAALEATGASPHDLARSLAGRVSLLMAGGGLRLAVLERAVGGAGALLATALGGQAHGYTRLRCLALAVPVMDGIARPDLVLDTEPATLIGRGTVDLGRERLDLTLAPRAKLRGADVALPVKVQGPLLRPAFGIDQEGTAVQLGALLGSRIFSPAVADALAGLAAEGGGDCLAIGSDPSRLKAPALPVEALKDPGKALDAAKGALGQAGRSLLEGFLRGR